MEPILCFKEEGGARPEQERRSDDAADPSQDERVLLRCRACGAEVADRGALFSVDGERVARVFANPAGFLHEIVTLLRARGLRIEGPATSEFSWFIGYAWEIAYCAECSAHLGWRYGALEPGIEPQVFYGLRRAQIVEG